MASPGNQHCANCIGTLSLLFCAQCDVILNFGEVLTAFTVYCSLKINYLNSKMVSFIYVTMNYQTPTKNLKFPKIPRNFSLEF